MNKCERLSIAFFFFFCKQKTAYEMRISDWSSDVCSSDLGRLVRCAKSRIVEIAVGKEEVQLLDAEVAKIMIDVAIIISAVQHADRRRERGAIGTGRHQPPDRILGALKGRSPALVETKAVRSADQTSELQSIMRISSAVFCMQKKSMTK